MDGPSSLVELLVDYCRKKRPSYAVMIEGPWGCGKSYFLRRRVAEQLKQYQINMAFVSLYGVADMETVRMRLVGACLASGNEKLGSSLTRIADAASRILGFRLSASDLDVIPLPENVVVCFDDLERTDLPLRQVFGYINQLTEHSKRPVIVVANERDELLKQDAYLVAKEKVVGETYRLSLDLATVFDGLVSEEVSDTTLKGVLRAHANALLVPFRTSRAENARVVRKTVLFAERLARHAAAYPGTDEVLGDVLRLTAALVIELDRDRLLEAKLEFLLTPNRITRPNALPENRADTGASSNDQREGVVPSEFDAYYDRFASLYFDGAFDTIPRVPLLLKAMFDIKLDWQGIVKQHSDWRGATAH